MNTHIFAEYLPYSVASVIEYTYIYPIHNHTNDVLFQARSISKSYLVCQYSPLQLQSSNYQTNGSYGISILIRVVPDVEILSNVFYKTRHYITLTCTIPELIKTSLDIQLQTTGCVLVTLLSCCLSYCNRIKRSFQTENQRRTWQCSIVIILSYRQTPKQSIIALCVYTMPGRFPPQFLFGCEKSMKGLARAFVGVVLVVSHLF